MQSKQMNNCNQCGICCKLFLINLNENEYLSGKYQTINSQFGELGDFALAEEQGLTFLDQNSDGSCIYLEGNCCSIHESRPRVCREFFCSSKDPKYSIMVEEIQKAKENM